MGKNIGIIGAGFAGLVTAKVLTEFGHRVSVFDKESEVGGVWTSSRRYPGLTTQNVRSTYALSDYPYPAHYPEWPTGRQVQEYLEGYVDHHHLRQLISLDSRVERAHQAADGSWTLEVARNGRVESHPFDFFVVCNGIFSEPFIPDYPGADSFTAAGGAILHTTDFHDVEDARGKQVIIVGYGKSSCDVADACAPVSAGTTIVARDLMWKVPMKIMNVLNSKNLLLTRMGEALFPYIERTGFEKFLHGAGKAIGQRMRGGMQSIIERQFKLHELDLHPRHALESISGNTVSLASDDFFDKIREGTLKVERDTEIVHMEPGKVRLANGKTLPADIVICGTGFQQRVPFLDQAIQAALTDERGNFLLYRHLLPIGVENLAFNGYNSSFFSQLNAEIGALWIAAYLAGTLELPPRDEQRAHVDRRLAWMEARTRGKHIKGTNIIPFSMHNVDELLGDLDLGIGRLTRLKEWFLPIDPRDYARLSRQYRERLARGTDQS